MNTQLVHINGQKAFTDSLVIAESVGLKHKKVIELIRKHKESFERFGQVPFQRALNAQGSATEYAELTEDQATFLITLFRNSPIVIEFKIQLVLEFRKALNEINRLYANPPRSDILKDKRKAHHPMMEALIELREELGKETEVHHFQCENKLCNFIVTNHFSKINEKELSNIDAEFLAQVRRRNESYIMAGLDYEERKKRLQDFGIRFRTKRISKPDSAHE